VAIRDVTKIPGTRAMEFGGKMYLLTLEIEKDPMAEDGDGGDDNLGNESVEVEKSPAADTNGSEKGNPMDTDPRNKTPANNISGRGKTIDTASKTHYSATPVDVVVNIPVESRVKSKILGSPSVAYKNNGVRQMRNPEENICIQLLEQFDEESEDEDGLDMLDGQAVAPVS
jgi:hypothetical protein